MSPTFRRRLFALVLGLLQLVAPGRSQGPAPNVPYPLPAAGWGPEAGHGRFVSRWAEDWRGRRATGTAPAGKAVPLDGDASLTVSAETRLRGTRHDNAQLQPGDDFVQTSWRGIVGAELRLDPHLRVFGELGSAHVEGRHAAAPANFDNELSLQQLFVDARGQAGTFLLGTMVGRQEFADGPPQLVSLGDGANLHRTWNGLRLYAQSSRFRLGAFALDATRLSRGVLDDGIDRSERLQGLNGSVIVARDSDGSDLYLDPFWFHTEDPDFRAGNAIGRDARDTFGARLWGRRGGLRLDTTVARQTGDFAGRDIDAWGLFVGSSVTLADGGWRPQLTAHVDVASGGTPGDGTLRGFHQLYASSGYLGEGRFLSLSNLLLIAPGVAASPTPTTRVSAECGFARRLDDHDAVYGGGMRAHAGTEAVSGHTIGALLRVAGTWSPDPCTTLAFGFEHLAAGDALERAGLPAGSYAHLSLTLRY